jgi:hypothetical protein
MARILVLLFLLLAAPALAQTCGNGNVGPLDARNNLCDVNNAYKALINVNGYPNRVIVANRLHQPDQARLTSSNYQVMSRLIYTIWPGTRDLVLCFAGWNTAPVESALVAANYVAQHVVVSNGGTGHAVNDIVALPTVAFTTAPAGVARVTRLRVTSIGGTGGTQITGVAIEDPGIYTAPVTGAQAQASTTGSGTGATFTIDQYSEFTTHLRVGVEPTASAAQSTSGLNAIRPVRFNGSQSAGLVGGTAVNQITPNLDGEVPAGKLICSDPVQAYVPIGGQIAVRTWINGIGSATGNYLSNVTLGDYETYGSPSTTDQSQSGTITPLAASAVGVYGPALILGTPLQPMQSFANFGTSIDNGVTGGSPAQDLGDSYGNTGWIQRAVGTTNPIHSFSSSGNQIAYLFNSTYGRNAEMDLLTKAATTDIGVFFGINDLNPAVGNIDEAAVLNYETQLSSELRSIRTIQKIFTSTTTPYATSGANTTPSATCVGKSGGSWTNTNGLEIRNALLRVGLIPFSGGVGGTYAPPATTFNSGSSTIGTGSQTVTPAAMSVSSGGATFSIVPGVIIVVDVGGANQEVVIPTATNATLTNGYPTSLGSTFTATFAKTHGINVAMTVYSPYAHYASSPSTGVPGTSGGYDFVIDFGTALESSLGSCLWAITSDTGDGLHPSYLTSTTGGQAHMATIAQPIIAANQ